MLTTMHKDYFIHAHKMAAVIIICLATGLLGACATTADKMDKLNQTLRSYEKAMRWAKFDMAYSFRKWEEGEEPSLPAHLKNIRVTNYDLIRQDFDEKTLTAKLTVSIHYYNQENLRERSLVDKQSWEYFPKQERWYLTSEFPDFQ